MTRLFAGSNLDQVPQYHYHGTTGPATAERGVVFRASTWQTASNDDARWQFVGGCQHIALGSERQLWR